MFAEGMFNPYTDQGARTPTACSGLMRTSAQAGADPRRRQNAQHSGCGYLSHTSTNTSAAVCTWSLGSRIMLCHAPRGYARLSKAMSTHASASRPSASHAHPQVPRHSPHTTTISQTTVSVTPNNCNFAPRQAPSSWTALRRPSISTSSAARRRRTARLPSTAWPRASPRASSAGCTTAASTSRCCCSWHERCRRYAAPLPPQTRQRDETQCPATNYRISL